MRVLSVCGLTKWESGFTQLIFLCQNSHLAHKNLGALNRNLNFSFLSSPCVYVTHEIGTFIGHLNYLFLLVVSKDNFSLWQLLKYWRESKVRVSRLILANVWHPFGQNRITNAGWVDSQAFGSIYGLQNFSFN